MKPFIETKISLDADQDVYISPTNEMDGIVIKTMELDGKTFSNNTYLLKEEAEILITKIQEMIKYLEL